MASIRFVLSSWSMSTRITSIEPGHRLQLPAEWVESLQIKNLAELEKIQDGIVIRPLRHLEWDDVFRTKLKAHGAGSDGEEPVLTRDDLLF